MSRAIDEITRQALAISIDSTLPAHFRNQTPFDSSAIKIIQPVGSMQNRFMRSGAQFYFLEALSVAASFCEIKAFGPVFCFAKNVRFGLVGEKLFARFH